MEYQLLVGYLLLFVAVGIGFIFVHLIIGKLIRPAVPQAEKLTIYECGEPTIGSAWIQFDLRFYVVALLFVIFDVEVAFFFPWAVVFGRANSLADDTLPDKQRVQLMKELVPPYPEHQAALKKLETDLERKGKLASESTDDKARAREAFAIDQVVEANEAAAYSLAWLAFVDIAVFFGVLLVGFAYLWKRGDLDWVRSVAAERAAAAGIDPAAERELVGAP